MLDTLTDGFGVLMNHGQETTVENYYATEEYKDFVTTMYDWQQKGYLSKDAATSTEGVENQVKAGSAFSYFSPTKPGYDTRAKLLCGYDMEIVPLSEPWAGTAQISYLTYGISSSCTDKDKAMQCLDYLYGNKEVLNLLSQEYLRFLNGQSQDLIWNQENPCESGLRKIFYFLVLFSRHKTDNQSLSE